MNLIPAKAIENSTNSKLGNCSTTMASQYTCPKTCPFYNSGCYAEHGFMGIHTKRLNNSDIKDPITIAEIEADSIDKLSGTKNLRLHVVGDCAKDEAAEILSAAAKKYISKNNKKVWTYTHGNTKRSSWGDISVLKSCHSLNEVRDAWKSGFAACLIVDQFKADSAYKLSNDIKGIPCPEQTKGITCDKCQICTRDSSLLKTNSVVLFSLHGSGKNKAKDKVYSE